MIDEPARNAAPRYLLVGSGGMLGHDLRAALDGHSVSAPSHTELDITDRAQCRAAVEGHDIVINAAAYTAVDAAEDDEAEAMRINAVGPENLALACAETGAVLVHYSTDYVFSGDGDGPYAEEAPLAPVSAYGRSKAEGERRAQAANPTGTIILRTAWLYGEHGPNFVRTMVRLYRENGHLTVVNDQHGQPTWSRDLAQQTVRMLATGIRSGVLHGTSGGATTWHGFAQAIVDNLGGDPSVVAPTSSAAFARPARRPTNSVLGHEGWARLGLEPMRHWRAALDDAMATVTF
jgi:dTDP-4-dehydrorhamnose reductase